ncbi:glycosyltransferase family 9 protein [bacterium]|nr:glycosyltransferase family 9 protein [candidate division CSSED10-310 bacterium]
MVMSADRLLTIASELGLIRANSINGKLPDRNDIRKLLVIRLAYIGDVVMTLPVLAPLRNAFPNAQIHFLTSVNAAPLLRNQPCLDEIIAVQPSWFFKHSAADKPSKIRQLLSNGYDVGFDFRGDIRNIWHCLFRPGIPIRISYSSGGGRLLLTHAVPWCELKHKVEYHLDLLRALGIEAASCDPMIILAEAEIAAARSLLDRIPGCRGESPIMVHPGARLPLKRWPAERFADLIKRVLSERVGPVVLVDSADSVSAQYISSRVPEIINLAGCLTLREMAAVASLARVFVCNDSGPMHIAAAVGTRVVALFGPSRSIETAPRGKGHRVIEADCPFKERCDESECLKGVNGCMSQISVDAVFAHVVRSD